MKELYVDEPLALITQTQKYYYHANHLYSVAALTNNAGTVVERYRYDAYGQRTTLAADGTTVRAQSNYGQQIAFTGQYLDQETGLNYFRTRYYSGTLGRFIGRDSFNGGSSGGGYHDGNNLYSAWFVPNYLDPTGMYKYKEDEDDEYCKIIEPCLGKWIDPLKAGIKPDGGISWEWGDGSVSWYGVEVIQICTNVEVKVRGAYTCENCPFNGEQVDLSHKPVKVCLGVEAPWWLAISIAFPASFPKLAVGLALAATRVLHRLTSTIENLHNLNAKVNRILAPYKTDAYATKLCKQGKKIIEGDWNKARLAIGFYEKING